MPLGFFDESVDPLHWFDNDLSPGGWFYKDFFEAFGCEGGGGGESGGGGSSGGGGGTAPSGPLTTTRVSLPPGVRMTASLLKQIMDQCGTCNPCGSGSGGSGSGRARIPCCEPAPVITTVSWAMTGAVCGCDGTESALPGDCNVPLEFAYPPEALSSVSSYGFTGVTCGDLVVSMSLCCIETANDGTFYRFGAGVSYTDGGGFTQAIFVSDFFDVASCELSYFEVNDLGPVSVEVIGIPGCDLSGLKLSVVFS